MGELINGRSPEEIITGLKCEVPCHKCAYRDHNFMKDDSCSYYVEQDIIALIEHLEARVPKWISVKERLPEEVCRCLVVTKRREESPMVNTATYNHMGWWTRWDFGEITHWMPLPEPPKEDV